RLLCCRPSPLTHTGEFHDVVVSDPQPSDQLLIGQARLREVTPHTADIHLGHGRSLTQVAVPPDRHVPSPLRVPPSRTHTRGAYSGHRQTPPQVPGPPQPPRAGS